MNTKKILLKKTCTCKHDGVGSTEAMQYRGEFENKAKYLEEKEKNDNGN